MSYIGLSATGHSLQGELATILVFDVAIPVKDIYKLAVPPTPPPSPAPSSPPTFDPTVVKLSVELPQDASALSMMGLILGVIAVCCCGCIAGMYQYVLRRSRKAYEADPSPVQDIGTIESPPSVTFPRDLTLTAELDRFFEPGTFDISDYLQSASDEELFPKSESDSSSEFEITVNKVMFKGDRIILPPLFPPPPPEPYRPAQLTVSLSFSDESEPELPQVTAEKFELPQVTAKLPVYHQDSRSYLPRRHLSISPTNSDEDDSNDDSNEDIHVDVVDVHTHSSDDVDGDSRMPASEVRIKAPTIQVLPPTIVDVPPTPSPSWVTFLHTMTNFAPPENDLNHF